jgi:hypothetical protein
MRRGQKPKYSLKLIFWSVAIVLGLLQVWRYRYTLSSDDAIAYLDIGDAYLKGDWKTAINGYWSPLYAWVLGVALAILKPSAYWEFFVVKLVNFFAYLFALIGFEFFLRELIFYRNTKISKNISEKILQIPEWIWIVSGYLLFLWSTLRWTPLFCDTPDMFTAALVYFAAGIVLRLRSRSSSWIAFIALGGTLAFAYFSKAVMFPVSTVFFAISAFSTSNLKRILPRVLVAFLVFAIVTAPYVTALSLKKGRFTFSDTGKLAHAWLVTGGVTPYRYWQGNDPGWGTPEHPPRVIFNHPYVLEFATPIGGTYPLWHDASYWYEGLKFQFNLTQQLAISLKNCFFYWQYFLGSLTIGYLFLILVGGSFWGSFQDLFRHWRLLSLAVAGLGAYAIGIDMVVADAGFAQPSTRYIAPFIVLLFAGVFTSIRLPNSQRAKRLIAGTTLVILVVIGSKLALQGVKDTWAIVNDPRPHIHWMVTESLQKSGLKAGERIAVLGSYIYPNYYWARLLRVKIIAEVIDEKDFWYSSPARRIKVLKAIKETGAKAIVQRQGVPVPNSELKQGWQKVGETDYYVYFFD